MSERESTSLPQRVFAYQHTRIATTARFLFYALVFYGMFSCALLLMFQFKPHGYQAWTLLALYVSMLVLSLVVSAAMSYRRLRTRNVVIGTHSLQMPHYWTSEVRYTSIRGVYANRPQRGSVSIVVAGQIIRSLKVKFLVPATTAEEFATDVNTRIVECLDEAQAIAQRTANSLALRQFGTPWFCAFCAFALLALHAAAWVLGSRFDGLDLIASGAAFNPIILMSDPLRVIDTTLLHANWTHVLTNFMAFAVYGSMIERLLGWRCVLVVFVVGSLCSIYSSILWSGTDLRVGASGGIMSFLGVFLFVVVTKPFPIPGTMLGLPMWLVIPLSILGLGILVPGVDWVAHTAGVVTGIAASAMMFRGAKRRAVDELLPVSIPRLLFIACIGVIGAALIDVSLRITHLTNGGRAATIEQILQSRASSDLIADVAWEELIERHESQRAIPNTIARLRQDPALTPISRGFLAALLAVHGDGKAALAEQRTALLSVAGDDPTRASRYAARLVRFAERVAPAERLLASETASCVEAVSLLRNAHSTAPTVISVRVGNRINKLNEPPSELLLTRAVAASDCAAKQSTWRIDAADWRDTTTLFPR